MSPYVTRSPRSSPSLHVFAYCKWSHTGGGNGLGTWLRVGSYAYKPQLLYRSSQLMGHLNAAYLQGFHVLTAHRTTFYPPTRTGTTVVIGTIVWANLREPHTSVRDSIAPMYASCVNSKKIEVTVLIDVCSPISGVRISAKLHVHVSLLLEWCLLLPLGCQWRGRSWHHPTSNQLWCWSGCRCAQEGHEGNGWVEWCGLCVHGHGWS